MEIIKTGQSGVMISLNSSDYAMIVSSKGDIDAVTARNIAVRAMQQVGIDCPDTDFLLDAFFGRESCLLFASKRTGDSYAVYKFRSLNDVCACANVIPPETPAALYYYKKCFFLKFSQCDGALMRTLSEYGRHIDDKEFLHMLESEGKALCCDKTVETLRKI